MRKCNSNPFCAKGQIENPAGDYPSGQPVIVIDKGAVLELEQHRVCYTRRRC